MHLCRMLQSLGARACGHQTVMARASKLVSAWIYARKVTKKAMPEEEFDVLDLQVAEMARELGLLGLRDWEQDKKVLGVKEEVG